MTKKLISVLFATCTILFSGAAEAVYCRLGDPGCETSPDSLKVEKCSSEYILCRVPRAQARSCIDGEGAKYLHSDCCSWLAHAQNEDGTAKTPDGTGYVQCSIEDAVVGYGEKCLGVDNIEYFEKCGCAAGFAEFNGSKENEKSLSGDKGELILNKDLSPVLYSARCGFLGEEDTSGHRYEFGNDSIQCRMSTCNEARHFFRPDEESVMWCKFREMTHCGGFGCMQVYDCDNAAGYYRNDSVTLDGRADQNNDWERRDGHLTNFLPYLAEDFYSNDTNDGGHRTLISRDGDKTYELTNKIVCAYEQSDGSGWDKGRGLSCGSTMPNFCYKYKKDGKACNEVRRWYSQPIHMGVLYSPSTYLKWQELVEHDLSYPYTDVAMILRPDYYQKHLRFLQDVNPNYGKYNDEGQSLSLCGKDDNGVCQNRAPGTGLVYNGSEFVGYNPTDGAYGCTYIRQDCHKGDSCYKKISCTEENRFYHSYINASEKVLYESSLNSSLTKVWYSGLQDKEIYPACKYQSNECNDKSGCYRKIGCADGFEDTRVHADIDKEWERWFKEIRALCNDNTRCYKAVACEDSVGAYSVSPNTSFFITISSSAHGVLCYRGDQCHAAAGAYENSPNTSFFKTVSSLASGSICYRGSGCHFEAGAYEESPNTAFFDTVSSVASGEISYRAESCNEDGGAYDASPNTSFFITISSEASGSTCYRGRDCHIAAGAYENAPNTMFFDVIHSLATGLKSYRAQGANLIAGAYEASPNTSFFVTVSSHASGSECYRGESCNFAAGAMDKAEDVNTLFFNQVVSKASGSTCYRADGCTMGAYPKEPNTSFFITISSEASGSVCYRGQECHLRAGAYTASPNTTFFKVDQSVASGSTCYRGTDCVANPDTLYFVTVKSIASGSECYRGVECREEKGSLPNINTSYFCATSKTDLTICYRASACLYATEASHIPAFFKVGSASTGAMTCYKATGCRSEDDAEYEVNPVFFKTKILADWGASCMVATDTKCKKTYPGAFVYAGVSTKSQTATNYKPFKTSCVTGGDDAPEVQDLTAYYPTGCNTRNCWEEANPEDEAEISQYFGSTSVTDGGGCSEPGKDRSKTCYSLTGPKCTMTSEEKCVFTYSSKTAATPSDGMGGGCASIVAEWPLGCNEEHGYFDRPVDPTYWLGRSTSKTGCGQPLVACNYAVDSMCKDTYDKGFTTSSISIKKGEGCSVGNLLTATFPVGCNDDEHYCEDKGDMTYFYASEKTAEGCGHSKMCYFIQPAVNEYTVNGTRVIGSCAREWSEPFKYTSTSNCKATAYYLTGECAEGWTTEKPDDKYFNYKETSSSPDCLGNITTCYQATSCAINQQIPCFFEEDGKSSDGMYCLRGVGCRYTNIDERYFKTGRATYGEECEYISEPRCTGPFEGFTVKEVKVDGSTNAGGSEQCEMVTAQYPNGCDAEKHHCVDKGDPIYFTATEKKAMSLYPDATCGHDVLCQLIEAKTTAEGSCALPFDSSDDAVFKFTSVTHCGVSSYYITGCNADAGWSETQPVGYFVYTSTSVSDCVKEYTCYKVVGCPVGYTSNIDDINQTFFEVAAKPKFQGVDISCYYATSCQNESGYYNNVEVDLNYMTIDGGKTEYTGASVPEQGCHKVGCATGYGARANVMYFNYTGTSSFMAYTGKGWATSREQSTECYRATGCKYECDSEYWSYETSSEGDAENCLASIPSVPDNGFFDAVHRGPCAYDEGKPCDFYAREELSYKNLGCDEYRGFYETFSEDENIFEEIRDTDARNMCTGIHCIIDCECREGNGWLKAKPQGTEGIDFVSTSSSHMYAAALSNKRTCYTPCQYSEIFPDDFVFPDGFSIGLTAADCKQDQTYLSTSVTVSYTSSIPGCLKPNQTVLLGRCVHSGCDEENGWFEESPRLYELFDVSEQKVGSKTCYKVNGCTKSNPYITTGSFGNYDYSYVKYENGKVYCKVNWPDMFNVTLYTNYCASSNVHTIKSDASYVELGDRRYNQDDMYLEAIYTPSYGEESNDAKFRAGHNWGSPATFLRFEAGELNFTNSFIEGQKVGDPFNHDYPNCGVSLVVADDLQELISNGYDKYVSFKGNLCVDANVCKKNSSLKLRVYHTYNEECVECSDGYTTKEPSHYFTYTSTPRGGKMCYMVTGCSMDAKCKGIIQYNTETSGGITCPTQPVGCLNGTVNYDNGCDEVCSDNAVTCYADIVKPSCSMSNDYLNITIDNYKPNEAVNLTCTYSAVNNSTGSGREDYFPVTEDHITMRTDDKGHAFDKVLVNGFPHDGVNNNGGCECTIVGAPQCSTKYSGCLDGIFRG